MKGKNTTAMLAAATIALGMITIGCVEEGADEAWEANLRAVDTNLAIDQARLVQELERVGPAGDGAPQHVQGELYDGTMPDPLGVLGDVDLDVNLPTIPAKVENLLLDSKTHVVIGYVHYETLQYVFASGLVLDPDQIVDLDESDVMIPDACDDGECTEDGDGHYPHVDGGKPIQDLNEVGMYVEAQGEKLVLCKLFCEAVPHPTCVEICQPYRP